MSSPSSSESSDSDKEDESTNWAKRRAVIVSGVDTTNEELRSYVEVYFQSKRLSGGGDVAEVQVLGDNQLRVVFTKKSALDEVVERLCKRKHVIMGKPVTVELDQDYPDKRRAPSSTAAVTSGIASATSGIGECKNKGDSEGFSTIEVTGLPKHIDEELLEMYFENRKYSKGEGVKRVQFDAHRSVALVTFADSAVARRVCDHQHRIQKTPIKVVPFVPQRTRPLTSTQLWIRGLPEFADEELLEIYFDNCKKSGGEGLVEVTMGPGACEAVITYSSAEVVRQVCSRKHVLSKCELTVSSEGPVAAAGPGDRDFSNRLLVTNIPKDFDYEVVEMYFEIKRRSGGGPIDDVKNYPEYGTAVITFADQDVVTCICRRGVHKVKGVELHVTPYNPELDPERLQQAKRCTISVLCPPGCCDVDTLEMYFENKKRSGGGDIQKTDMDIAKSCARITFSDAEVASHVTSRPHKLQGKLLTVELLSESKSNESEEKSNEFEDKMLLVLDVSDNINEELLGLYITTHTKVDVERIDIRRENSRALVVLRDTYDFEAAAERVKKNLLSKQHLRVRQVPICCTVRISNAATIGLNEQFIQLYFQSLKFNVDVAFYRNDADVTFSTPSDVREVLQKEHTLNKHILQLQPVVQGWDFAFADEAESGVLADNKLGAATQASAVKPLSIAVDLYLLQFVKNSEESFRKLQQSLNAVHAAVKDFNTESLSVQPLDGVQRVMNWQRRVRNIVESFIGTLQHIEVEVSRDVLSEVSVGKEFKDRLSAFQKRVLLFVDEQRCVIHLIGLAGNVRQAKREVDNLVAEAEEVLTNVIQEEVRVRPNAILLLEKLGVFQEVEHKYRHIKVLRSKKKGMFIVEGPRRVVSQAAGEIRKKGQEVSELTIDFSSQSDINLMTSAKGVEFAQALVDRAGLEAAVGTKPKEGKRPPQLRLVGWVNNEVELEEMKEKLKDLVTKRTLKLRPCETEAMQIAKWEDLVALVHDAYLVQLVENAKGHYVQLNGASEHIDLVHQLLQKFFQANAIINESLKLEPGQVRYLTSYCKDHIGAIEKKFGEFKVTVRLQKASLEIRGTEQGVRLAMDRGMTLLRNIAEESVEVVKPGMKKYFAKEEAKKLLATIEVQNRVVIEKDSIVAQPCEPSLSFAVKLAQANVSTWLRLYGPDARSVARARREIEDLMTSKYRDKVIQREGICCLASEDVTRIQDAADEFGIDIHLERDIGRICLHGDLISVADASGLILEIISNAAERTRTENHAKHVSTLVEWVRVRGSVEEPYDKITNAKLEDGLIAKKASVEVIVKGRVCTVVFDDMEEIRRGAAAIPVKRNDLVKKEELPKTWSSQQGQKVLLVQLATTDTEYQAVDQAFKRTSTRTVVKIERVQNPELYRQYTANKESMDKGGIVKNGANEKRLYHGSDATSAQAIYTQGFNRSYAGRHATAYGRGVYFAVTAKYSEGYAQAASNGQCCMFQSLVLAGDFCQGNSGMVSPPPRDPNISQVDLFDSTVDNVNSPSMYVTYNDAQTYPEYLITFQ